jgi:Ca2+-binding EF-hand superfamily protein
MAAFLRRRARAAVWVAVMAVLIAAGAGAARAYTAKQAQEIFDILDSDHDGKVSKLEFEANKIDAFYFRDRKNPQDPRLRYEDTGLSREFFDKADEGHKGYLTGLDLVDAIHFESIDTTHRGYFDFAQFVAALKTISR